MCTGEPCSTSDFMQTRFVVKINQASTCSFTGQVKFSVMRGRTHVHPHCGPTNCRVRCFAFNQREEKTYSLSCHLSLITPQEARIRVANETRHWKQGRFICLDDSFEHEVFLSHSLTLHMRGHRCGTRAMAFA